MATTTVRDLPEPEDKTLFLVMDGDNNLTGHPGTIDRMMERKETTEVRIIRLLARSAESEEFDSDDEEARPKVKLTVEEILPENAEDELKPGDSAVPPDFVDPLSQLDTEQMLKLKKALASDQAKQLLGDNVTAMLDVLSVDDNPATFLQNSIRRDHCYTPLSPSADPRGASFVLANTDPNSKKLKGRPKSDNAKPSGSGLGQQTKTVVTPTPTTTTNTSDNEEPDDNDAAVGKEVSSDDTDSDDRDRSSDSDYRENSGGLKSKRKGGRGCPWGSRRIRGGIRGRKPLRGRGRVRVDTEESIAEPVETVKINLISPMANPGSRTIAKMKQLRAWLALGMVLLLAIIDVQQVQSPTEPSPPAPALATALKRGRPRKSDGSVKNLSSTTTAAPEPPVVIPIDHVAAKIYSVDAIRLGRPQAKSEEERKRDIARIMHKLDASGQNASRIKFKSNIAGADNVAKAERPQFKVIAVTEKKPATPKIDDQLSEMIETLEDGLEQEVLTVAKTTKPLRTYVRKDESKVGKTNQEGEAIKAIAKPATPAEVPPVNVMGGKYPRRENRKLPSHFADTIGPALFSAPDQARKRAQNIEEASASKNKVAGKIVQKSLLKYVVKSCISAAPPSEPVAVVEEVIENVSTSTPDDSFTATVNAIESMLEEGLEASVHSAVEQTNIPQAKTENDDKNIIISVPQGDVKNKKEVIVLGKNVTVRRKSVAKVEEHDTRNSPRRRKDSETVKTEVTAQSETPVKEDAATPIKPKSDSDVKSNRRASRDAKISTPSEKTQPKAMERKPSLDSSQKVKIESAKIEHKEGGDSILETKGKEEVSAASEDRKRNAVKRRRSDEVSDLDSDIDDTLSEASWNSEDDPERLWCICRKPHNNRFMICCDLCEDWFHGKCVGITKSIGKQMEQDGLEWSCPPCSKKKRAEDKEKENKSESKGPEFKQTKLSGFTIKRPSDEAGERKCIMCKGPVRENSIYCSDKCILSHSQKAIAQLSSANKTSDKPAIAPAPLKKEDRHVIVMDPTSKKVLAGSSAPTLTNLATWLKENPSYHVLYQKRTNVNTPNSKDDKKIIQLHSTNKLPGDRSTQTKLLVSPNSKHIKIVTRPAGTQFLKTVPAGTVKKNVAVVSKPDSSHAEVKQKVSESPKNTDKIKVETPKPVPRRRKEKHQIISEFKSPTPSTKMEEKERSSGGVSGAGEQAIRDSVRKTLGEALKARKTDCADLQSKELDIDSLATKIEERLYKLFDNKVDVKYKSKYRSLVFNIKDVKNQTLYRKILENAISPKELVRLTADEMASQELAQWREKENQHQLEMIKKTELELMALGQTFIIKSHKGEEVIEKDQKVAAVAAALDPNTSAQELVSALNSVTSTTPDAAGEDEDVKGSETSLMKMNKKEKERRREKERKHKRDRSRSRNSRHSKRRKKSRSRSKDRHRSSRSAKSRSSRHSRDSRDKDRHKEKDEKDNDKDKLKPSKEKVDKIEEEPAEISTSADIEIQYKEAVSDEADYEPTSTVTIKTPETFPEEQDDVNESASVWVGQIIMPDVAKFHGIALEASGDCTNVDVDVSDQVSVVGRIPYNTVWEYIKRMQKMATKDIIIMQILPIDIDADKASFSTLFNYLSKRSRIAVIGRCSDQVKDFYLYPHIKGTPLPDIIDTLKIPSAKDSDQILLGIIVRTKRGVRPVPPLPLPPTVPVVPARQKLPLPLPKSPVAEPEQVVTSQPVVESMNTDPRKRKIKVHVEVTKSPSPAPAAADEDDSPYSPASSDEDLPPLSKLPRKVAASNPVSSKNDAIPNPIEGMVAAAQIQKKIEEMNRAIEEETMQIKNLTATATGPLPVPAPIHPVSAVILPGPAVVASPVPQLDLALKALKTLAASKPLPAGNTPTAAQVEESSPTTPMELDIPLPPSPVPDGEVSNKESDKCAETAPVSAPLMPEVSQISIPSDLHEILANINKQSKQSVEKTSSSLPPSPKSPEPLPPGVDDVEVIKHVKGKPDRSAVFESDGVPAFSSRKKPIKFDLKLKSRDLDERQNAVLGDVDERPSTSTSSLDQRIALALDHDDRDVRVISAVSSGDRDDRTFRSTDIDASIGTRRDKDDRISRYSPTSDKNDKDFRRQDRWKNDGNKRRGEKSRDGKWKDDLEDEWAGSIRRHEDEARRRSRSIRTKEIEMLKQNADRDSD